MSNYSWVTCLNVAVGDTNGTSEFFVDMSSSSSSLLAMKQSHRELFPFTGTQETIPVIVARLDDVVIHEGLRYPDLVKIDVQGFEDRVIAGGTDALGHASFCIVEVSLLDLYEGAVGFDDIYETMKDLGFKVAGFSEAAVASDGRQAQIDVVFGRNEA
jgi:FkbM family methyltransferase